MKINGYDKTQLNETLIQEFLDSVFNYYTSKSMGGISPGQSLNEGLTVFLKLKFCRSLSLFLLNRDTYEFTCYKTLSGLSVEDANRLFCRLVESGRIALAIETGSVTGGIDADTYPANQSSETAAENEEDILIIPLINSSGIEGLILFQAEIPLREIPHLLSGIFQMFACHLAEIIKFNEFQSELKASNETFRQELSKKVETLIQSKNEITKILDSLQTGIFIIDKKSNQILDVNSVACSMLGTTKDKLIGTDRNQYCSCSCSRIQDEPFLCKITDDPGCSLEGNGSSPFYIIRKITSITLGDSEEYYLESFMDATERRLAELELQRMKNELEERVKERTASLTIANELLLNEISVNRMLYSAVVQSPVSILITGSEWKVEYINPSFTHLTGYKSSEVSGSSYLQLEVFAAPHPEGLTETLRAEGEWKKEVPCRKKSGEEFWALISASAIRNEEGDIVHHIFMIEDITELKLMEENLQKAKDKAEASSRIKSEFLSMMSHEIRTPVNTMLNFTSLLKSDLEDSMTPDMEESYNMITSGGLRLIRTVDLILNVADIQTDSYEANFEVFDLHSEIMEKITGEFKVSCKVKNVDFSYSCPAHLKLIRGDRHSVMQILLNVIDNAVKYTEKGSVDIVLSNDEKNNIVFTVKDTGIGISEDYMPRIFTLFSQEETGYTRKFDGNGLGLVLVKKFCDLNGAKPEIISRKGEGTIVSILFKPAVTGAEK